MKGLVVYLAALAVGAGVGAVGMGAYNVVVVGVETEVADSTAIESEDAAGTDVPELQASDAIGGDEGGGEDLSPAEDGPEGGASIDVAETSDDAPTTEQPAPAVVQEAAAPDPDSLARAQLNFQRLARIFAAMKPDEAAPVLAQLDDTQLEGILLAMQGRNAAPILAEMDPERAASLSRRVLGGNR